MNTSPRNLLACFSTIAWLAAAASPVSRAADAASVTAFTHARLIDGNGGPALENATLVIDASRILAVGPAATTPAPAGATVIDAHGQTIMPGLLTAHSHLGVSKGAAGPAPENYSRENVAAQLLQYESYGVLGVMSLGLNRDEAYTWRDEQKVGKFEGADMFLADRGIGVVSGAPPFPLKIDQVYRPTNADEARAAVTESAARHPDLLKIWVDDLFGSAPKMAPEIYQTAINTAHAAFDEAHKHNLRVAAHVFYLADAKALVKAGLDVIAHSVRDVPVDAEFIALLKEKAVPYIPTLTLDEAQFIYAEHPAFMDDPFFVQAVDPGLLASWLTPEYASKMAANPNTPKNKAASETGRKNVKTLHDAGVTIALGTDSGALPTRVQGWFEHRELQLLVAAGLKPMDAIVCATRNAAQVIGVGADRGTLEPGKRADFLVLAANPLDDIRNTTKLVAIYHTGKKIEPRVKADDAKVAAK
ncbi:MAG: amidohydrolase family protein [Verrucomicrobia bacterium]|nr:amidohydrolase family protein [Verrucomicrobiota bacterium]